MTTPSRVPTFLSSVAGAPGDLLNRIRGEYLEMPGLRLTSAQAARLWAVELELASALLSVLVEAGFLTVSDDGQHARRGDSEGRRGRHTTARGDITRADSNARGRTVLRSAMCEDPNRTREGAQERAVDPDKVRGL